MFSCYVSIIVGLYGEYFDQSEILLLALAAHTHTHTHTHTRARRLKDFTTAFIVMLKTKDLGLHCQGK